MNEVIELTGISEFGRHGVYDLEKQNKQEFVVDLEIYLVNRSGADEISQTVDYAALTLAVRKLISDQQFDLIETLADSIATHCLNHLLVERVKVKVHKPAAAKSLGITDVAVSILKSR
jgi:dihydroneopterin aldolase